MERLTEEYNDNYVTKKYFASYKTYDELEKDNQNALNKLGKIEDLEEEIGCPLDFVATPYKLSGLKKIWYHKQWCDVVRIVVYEEATRPYMEVRCKDYKYLKQIFLDDYKNTWWLKETKEE